MATIFIGHVKSKRDKIAEAAPLFAKYGQIAGEAISDYTQASFEREQAKKKEEMTRLLFAKELAGSWSRLPQATKNEIPNILGLEMNRDPVTNDVVINPRSEDLMEEAVRGEMMSDPESALSYGLTKAGVQAAKPHPDTVALKLGEIDAELEGKRMDRQTRLDVEEYRRGRISADSLQKHLYTMGQIRERNRLKRIGESDFSGVYAHPDTGELIPAEQMGSVEDSDTLVPLTGKDLDRRIKVLDANNKNTLDRLRVDKLNIDTRMALHSMAAEIAADPRRMGLLKALQAALKSGDTATAKQLQQELEGFASEKLQEAGVEKENYIPIWGELSSFFYTEQDVGSLLNAATRLKVELETGVKDPNVFEGLIGDIPFKATKKTKTAPKAVPLSPGGGGMSIPPPEAGGIAPTTAPSNLIGGGIAPPSFAPVPTGYVPPPTTTTTLPSATTAFPSPAPIPSRWRGLGTSYRRE